MELIMEKGCAVTGTLSKRYGYFIARSGKRFFGRRNGLREVPRDGHLRFILSCTELAKGPFVRDIAVPKKELLAALLEAGITERPVIDKAVYNAEAIRQIKPFLPL